MQVPQLIPTGLIKEVYTDLAKPGMHNVGKAIGNILGLGNTILLPLYLVNERAKIIAARNLEMFRKRIQNEKPENIIEPAPEIAVPILERLVYVSDAKIAELYVALLSSACRANFKGCAHSSFVKIIEAISPDEALILKYLATERDVIGHETLRAGDENGPGFDRRSRVVAFPKKLGLAFPKNATLYCENLEGLGILRNDGELANEVHYKDVKKVTDPVITKWKREQPFLVFSRKRGSYHLTRLGMEFVIACGYDDPKIRKDLLRFWV